MSTVLPLPSPLSRLLPAKWLAPYGQDGVTVTGTLWGKVRVGLRVLRSEAEARRVAKELNRVFAPDCTRTDKGIEHLGEVHRATDDGFIFILEREAPDIDSGSFSFSVHCVTLRDVVPEYRGESPQELGIVKGTKVMFTMDGNKIVSLTAIPQIKLWVDKN